MHGIQNGSLAQKVDVELTEPANKTQLAQFFTPPGIARFMVDLFERNDNPNCRLLDPGAGEGALSDAFLERWARQDFGFETVAVDAFEIDGLLYSSLNQTLSKYNNRAGYSVTIRNADFIDVASDWLCGNLFASRLPKYTHIIMNPPYRKIRSDSGYRRALRRAGIETVNLYTAFVALSLALLDSGGQLVAIIPRSFCNGPYYRPFRNYLLEHATIKHIHLFDSRSKAFKDDGVLQENLIIALERDRPQGLVTISTSTDSTFADLASHEYPFEQIVFPSDPERFIHIPTSPRQNLIEVSSSIQYSLADLGITVSTGPVVDFRVKEYLRDMPGPNTAPLLYPAHFTDHKVVWPIKGSKKANAIVVNEETKKWLYPIGYYCVIRRFSTKEERRRLMANVIEPHDFTNYSMLGFENHLNILHEEKQGLPELLAHGLALFLNTTAADKYFRRFSGHTQVNATDLRSMKFPSRAALTELGRWAKQHKVFSQTKIDAQFDTIIL